MDQNRLRKFNKCRTSSDQDRGNFGNRGPTRTRTGKILEIPDQLEPGPDWTGLGPRKISKSRTGPDQDQQNFDGPWIPSTPIFL